MSAPGERLLVLVGPSGVGKDSLLAAWRDRLDARGEGGRLHTVRRTISRPAGAGGEAHEAVDPGAWRLLRDQGAFALHWEAHGLGYGVRHAELAALERAADWVLLNGSRAALGALRRRFPAARVIEVHAQAATLARRLAARGREDAAAVAARLERTVQVQADLRIGNDGALEDAVALLDHWWRAQCGGLSATG